MKRRLACLALLAGLYSGAAAQRTSSRFNIGLDIAPLISGTPQLLADYYFTRHIGVSINGGYLYHPIRGSVKVDDGVNLEYSRGAYFKIGIKGRKEWARPRCPDVFAQLFYIGSYYDEQGTKDNWTTGREPVSAKGFVSGFAMVIGGDVVRGKRFDLRIATQLGYYKRSDHLSSDFMTFQPGFGCGFDIFDLPQQLMLGIIYKVGTVSKGKQIKAAD